LSRAFVEKWDEEDGREGRRGNDSEEIIQNCNEVRKKMVVVVPQRVKIVDIE